MKWIKTLEKYKEDIFQKIEKEKDESEEELVVLSKEEEEEDKKEEISDSYVDDEGVVHIDDWQQY